MYNYKSKEISDQKRLLVLGDRNIAKGTTDPRVEFLLQVHSSQYTNLDRITISESRLSINFKISNKYQHFD